MAVVAACKTSSPGGRQRRPNSIRKSARQPGAVRAADRKRSGAERRARTSAVATLAAARIGASGVPAAGKHARRWAARGTPRTGVLGYPAFIRDPLVSVI